LIDGWWKDLVPAGGPELPAGKLIVFSRKLDIARVGAARGRDGVDPAAVWALSDEGGQGELGSAPLTGGLQAAARDRLDPDLASVGMIDEFNQFSAFGKGTASVAAV
jgi:hypothetical protein